MKNTKRFFIFALLSLFLISFVSAVECGRPYNLSSRRLELMEKRQPIKSEGFERVEQLANLITLGRGVPIEQRGFIGQVAQQTVLAPLGLVTLPGLKSVVIGVELGLEESIMGTARFTKAVFNPIAKTPIARREIECQKK